MKATINSPTSPMPRIKAPGDSADFYLEIEPQGHGKIFRLPVRAKDLAAEGIILELTDPPPGLEVEALLQQEGTIHMAPDGFSKETQLRSKVVWARQGEPGSSHYLLGVEMEGTDFRSRRSLENLLARPKDISDLWTHWDRAQTEPATASDSRIMFYVGAGALLGGVALQIALPDSYHALAMILTLVGIYAIAGKCLLNWWRGRSVVKGC
jgi:hypothetical protein